MEDGAVMLREKAVARGAVELPPRTAIRMTIRPQIAQPQPAAILTVEVGTKVPGGIDGTGASVGRRPELRSWRRRWNGLASLLFTPHTGGLLGQTRKRFGFGRPRALGLGWHGWDGRAWLGPRAGQQDEQPDENTQSEWVEKQV